MLKYVILNAMLDTHKAENTSSEAQICLIISKIVRICAVAAVGALVHALTMHCYSRMIGLDAALPQELIQFT